MDYIKTIQLNFCTVSLRNDGIIENRYERETCYEIDSCLIEQINEAVNSLFGGKKRALLTVTGLYGAMTPEARNVDVEKSVSQTIAMGVVLQALSQRLSATFHFKLKKIGYPIQFFRKEDAAVLWLKKQIELA